jgi:protein-L-isoaspartate(D-aspartate) O-methyltransferase
MQPQVARDQMTYQQVRAWSVLAPEVLQAFETLPREQFVPEAWRGVAYADLAIPLPHGQHMLQPSVAGRFLEAADVRRTDQVLEIGTGSGYLTACLALLGADVRSIEIHADLARRARVNLKAAGIGNATVEDGDGLAIAEASPRYNVVVITGSMPVYDPRFESLLKPGGRLVVTVGNEPAMEARLIRRDAAGTLHCFDMFETVLDPLVHAPTPTRFVF